MTIYDEITVITLYSNNSKLFNKKKILDKNFLQKNKDFDEKITKSREKKINRKKPILKQNPF